MTKNSNLDLIVPSNFSQTYYNKTTLFMLPAIGFKEEKTNLKLLKYFGFVNCYLTHIQSPIICDDCLVLIFNPSNQALEKFKDFYSVYRTYPNYVTDYPIDYRLIAVVFKVLPKWKESLKAFKESKYSGMSTEYADLFKSLDMGTGKIVARPEYFIIKKDDQYRKRLEESLSNVVGDQPPSLVKIEKEAELMSPLNPLKENLNYEFTQI